MYTEIQFIKGLNEPTLPIIKLTKSRNGETGTATFLFIKPIIFEKFKNSFVFIEAMYLVGNMQLIQTTDLIIFFKEGHPFLLKAVFIFKNSSEWFNFLKFMNYYSKKNGLWFSEQNFI